MKNAIILIVFSICLSCNVSKEEVSNTAIVAGDISNFSESKLNLINYEKSDKPIEITLGNEGQFSNKIDLEEGNYFAFGAGRSYTSVYLKPGDSLFVDANWNDFNKSITYSGSSAEENQYLVNQQKLGRQLNLDSIYRSEPNFKSFVQKLDSVYEIKSNFLNENKDEFTSEAFLSDQKKWLKWDKILAQNNFAKIKNQQNKRNGDTLALVDYSFAGLDVTDADLLKFPERWNLINNYLSEQKPPISTIEINSAADYYSEFLKRALQLPESPVKTKTVGNYMSILVDFGVIEESEKYMDDYLALSPDSTDVADLKENIAAWSKIAEGKMGPSFSGTHLDGSKFEIKDLLGKVVYIDVWATWCAPCKIEIPHLKELAKEYKDKDIVFLSASIDSDEDVGIWKDFVQKENLEGMQIHIPSSWKSDLVESYIINGIPRFILLNKEGEIVDNNAARPSSGDEIKAELNKLIY